MFLPKFLGGGSRVSGKIARGGPPILRIIAFLLTSFSKICLGGCCFIPPLPPLTPPVCIYGPSVLIAEETLVTDGLLETRQLKGIGIRCQHNNRIGISLGCHQSLNIPGLQETLQHGFKKSLKCVKSFFKNLNFSRRLSNVFFSNKKRLN